VISKEEIFGPVVVVNSFETDEEALKRANDSEYGLYASIFTQDIRRALKFSKALEAGCVAVNTSSPNIAIDMPFGGFKLSGQGRELGPDAVRAWQETKSVFIKL
jgi:aldehyde dehydrogenase (NAD+)